MELRCPHCHTKNRIPPEKVPDGPRCGQCKESLFSGPIDADSQTVSQLIGQTYLPVLIDFWAPWCGPCRSFAPVFKSAAEKFQHKIIFTKVDTESHPDLGQQYGIRSIPTLAAFSKGKEIERISGALSHAQLEQWIYRLKY